MKIKTHVLRYWEPEFSVLQPVKSRANQRLYRRKDVETALLIKDLLYRQGFTIAGARKKISSEMNVSYRSESAMPTAEQVLKKIKTDLLRIQQRLRGNSLSE